MPFMIFPVWLALAGIDRRLLEASWVLGRAAACDLLAGHAAPVAARRFRRGDLRLRRRFGEVAVSLILGGIGYQLIGNAIGSALDVLNYPLAAAISTVATGLMLALLLLWYRLFDIRLFLGKIMGRA